MRPLTDQEIKKHFGTFTWREGRGGAIIIDKNWVALNIVREDMPIVGRVACHKQIVLDLLRIFTEISQAGLAKHIDTAEFKNNIAGCWVARHMLWNPKRKLSDHAWGIAIDFNVGQNPYGMASKQHPAIVEIFERRGFFHGGRWVKPDGMHFTPSNLWKPLEQVMRIQCVH